MQYQTLRSVSDHHVFVVCLDGSFYEIVPGDVRRQGPWQGMHRGELSKLNPDYWLDIEEQGYSLVRCELAVFKPEGVTRWLGLLSVEPSGAAALEGALKFIGKPLFLGLPRNSFGLG